MRSLTFKLVAFAVAIWLGNGKQLTSWSEYIYHRFFKTRMVYPGSYWKDEEEEEEEYEKNMQNQLLMDCYF